jgi:hypothetical protein
VSESVAREYRAFVAAQHGAEHVGITGVAMASGDVGKSILVERGQASELLAVAAKRAAGFFRPTKRTEVVWIEGGSQLAVNLVDIHVDTRDGLIVVGLPVRCDEVGSAVVEVPFAVGSPDAPAGFYASSFRRPSGPALIVDGWRAALVAFAWHCVLEMVSGLAAAAGKDGRGNVLVPAELTATRGGLEIVPMARHRFAGSSGLASEATR